MNATTALEYVTTSDRCGSESFGDSVFSGMPPIKVSESSGRCSSGGPPDGWKSAREKQLRNFSSCEREIKETCVYIRILNLNKLHFTKEEE